MAVRDLIRIDEALCDGCGQCVPACAEGAIAIIDGKAKLVSDVYCDGMGACLGHCPQGAITIEQVEARPFDEAAVVQHLAAARPASPEGPRPRAAAASAPSHLADEQPQHAGSCPGSRTLDFRSQPQPYPREAAAPGTEQPSALRQWPVQLHLLSPAAPFFRGADVLLAADCVAFAVGDFHAAHLADHALAIACPKLDVQQESYREKLTAMIDHAGIASLTVMIMQVPCCGGLAQLALQAAARASRTVPMRYVVVGVQGDVIDQGPLAVPDRARASASLPVRQ
jgi:ferredoxin